LNKNFILIIVCAAFGLCGCVTSSGVRGERAQTIADIYGFLKHQIPTQNFTLIAYEKKLGRQGEPLTFYIEGDGYAWISPSRPSSDPTPREPMVLYLAAQDPAANVVYLARPCQYAMNLNPQCKRSYWTDARFSNDVVESMNDAVTYFIKKYNPSKIRLIGYSGGAAIALLIADRRSDITSLVSVAGNLDPIAVNRHHRVSPLAQSMNPLENIEKIRTLPQIHFSGMKDEVIPSWITKNYMEKIGGSSCAEIKVIPGLTHQKGWKEKWYELVQMPIPCESKEVII